jgi:septum formation protein
MRQPLVLASESPSRRRALDLLGLHYEVRPSRIDEKAIRHNDPGKLVRLLAEAKARSIVDSVQDAIVIAGDAVVTRAGKIFEKPMDLVQAQDFLHEFSGSAVDYVTAIAVANCTTGKVTTSVQMSRIVFRPLLAGEIADYVRRYDVLACAGAFECDGVARFSKHVSGPCNYATGFSINDLVLLLRQEGVTV